MEDHSGDLAQTVLHAWHIAHGAKMMPFGGFDMPILYSGVIDEHLATRTAAGLFDVSHMGRFLVSGRDALPYVQRVLTNNAATLDSVGMSQYTLIPDEHGFAVDDAYLYRVGDQQYMVVVNAANRQKDWDWLQAHRIGGDYAISDISGEFAMISLQGPRSTHLLNDLLARETLKGLLPDPQRNRSSVLFFDGISLRAARTGYTGEPVCYELFVPTDRAVNLWEALLDHGQHYGVKPIGLGARDTLRLEAALPLYGHELGLDPEGNPIPIGAIPLAKIAGVSFSDAKGDFIGREALFRQAEERVARTRHGVHYDQPLEERVLPRVVLELAIMNDNLDGPGRAPPRAGHEVYLDGKRVGYVTSGTTVPSWEFSKDGILSQPTEGRINRPIALAYLDATLFPSKAGEPERQVLTIRDPKSGRESLAYIVTANMRALAPYVHPIIHPEQPRRSPQLTTDHYSGLAADLVHEAAQQTAYRQHNTINLIPSENTPSELVRTLSICDAMGRYGEHQQLKALGLDSADIAYYEGTEFILRVEEKVRAALGDIFGASQVEARPISGQQANEAVFSAMVQWLNRARMRGTEPRRMGSVLANLLIRGGHLSQQYFGAMRDTVAIDPVLDRPAVHPFPVHSEDPYAIDVEATKEAIERYRPELIIFGKSMFIYPEPVREIADFVADRNPRPIIMYDGAHVIGLLGPHFQQPLQEGADILTGSMHKTFPGPQRGCIASRMDPGTEYAGLWNAILQREFPGKLSNHHLGTLVALLGAAYEFKAFGEPYQVQVLANAKAYAQGLVDEGLSVAGNPARGYTETHQVILNVGIGNGPAVAQLLRRNNIITNNQGSPTDLGFSHASAIRMGVAEMTRFGMKEPDFRTLAGYVAEVVKHKMTVGPEVSQFRRRFTEMHYVFPAQQTAELVAMLQDAWK
ncbi:glycine cleavage system aminomethyltransferase GcvT [Candidatus Woesearchaeota archaeon]|nr:glycine cleavage system aminomethyltransferase GcvT [Candidatus Woesearchaeota archaeon]